jgi:hypothetical protein
LNDKEVVGIRKITRKIKEPIFPNIDDIAFKMVFPRTPPKLLPKYKSPIEQKQIIKNKELTILTSVFVIEL